VSLTRHKHMFETFWRVAALIIGFSRLLGPLALRYTFRFAARCKPVQVPEEDLPLEVATIFRARIPQLLNLGFDLVGCYDCGALANDTRNYVAYFCDYTRNDFASVTALITPRNTASYFEFSTRFSNGATVETNTNSILPLTPANPGITVCRFPEITEPEALYQVHHRLIEKYAGGRWAQSEPKGEEIQRLVRVLENYGPRHARIGYMYRADGGEFYQLTWKGALLMTWRGLWPASLLRRQMQRQEMESELRSLEGSGVTALQKA